jgi:hypothetical protein
MKMIRERDRGKSPRIEKGIPVPSKPFGAANPKYRFSEMEVNDSFLVPLPHGANGNTKDQMDALYRRVAGAASQYKNQIPIRKSGWDYTCARVDGGVRVWRIK